MRIGRENDGIPSLGSEPLYTFFMMVQLMDRNPDGAIKVSINQRY